MRDGVYLAKFQVKLTTKAFAILFITDISILDISSIFNPTMGGFQRAGTGKNKKVTENSPLLAFCPERAKE